MFFSFYSEKSVRWGGDVDGWDRWIDGGGLYLWGMDWGKLGELGMGFIVPDYTRYRWYQWNWISVIIILRGEMKYRGKQLSK